MGILRTMTNYNYEEFDSLHWRDSKLITTEEVLDFLDIYYTCPLREGRVTSLIAEGFTYTSMYKTSQELYLYKDHELAIWDDVMESNKSERVAKPNRLSILESARVFHLASCMLAARKVFMSEVGRKYFLLHKHEEFLDKTPLQWIMEGRAGTLRVMNFLESLPEWNLIPHRYYRSLF